VLQKKRVCVLYILLRIYILVYTRYIYFKNKKVNFYLKNSVNTIYDKYYYYNYYILLIYE